MATKLSVIIPIYNSESFIKDCITFLRNQNYNNFEILFVIDYKSTDDSINILHNIQSEDESIRVIVQQDDDAAGGARNIGIDNAKGEYIWFLDVDDQFSPSMIEELIAIADAENQDVVASNFFYSKKSAEVKIPSKQFSTTIMDSKEALLQVSNGFLSTNLWNKLICKQQIEDAGIRFSKEYSEDYQFLNDLMLSVNRIVYYNKPLYIHYILNGTRSYGMGNEIARRDLEIYNVTLKRLEKEKLDALEDYRRIGLIHVLKSLTNVDVQTYNQLSNSPIIIDNLPLSSLSKEILLFKCNKKLFYYIGHSIRAHRYSKTSMIFDSKTIH